MIPKHKIKIFHCPTCQRPLNRFECDEPELQMRVQLHALGVLGRHTLKLLLYAFMGFALCYLFLYYPMKAKWHTGSTGESAPVHESIDQSPAPGGAEISD